MKYQIKRRFRFEAAHFLPKYDGACKNMHGHSYKLEVTLEAHELLNGMVFDFKDFKHLVHSKVVDKYDHQLLNEHFETPTAEMMAETIFCTLSAYFKGTSTEVTKVELWETEDCSASVTE